MYSRPLTRRLIIVAITQEGVAATRKGATRYAARLLCLLHDGGNARWFKPWQPAYRTFAGVCLWPSLQSENKLTAHGVQLQQCGCGAVRCGAVWCGAMWCDVVRCGAMWCDVVRCGGVWCGAVVCGVV